MKTLHSAILLLSAALAGCDTLYGVRRQAQITSLPSIDCVKGVLTATPGILAVEEVTYSGGAAITLSGLKEPATISHSFIYRGSQASHIGGMLQLTQDHRGYMSFVHSRQNLNSRPAQAEIDATRPVMRVIEQRVAIECGVPNLPTQIREICIGVQCVAEQQTTATVVQ